MQLIPLNFAPAVVYPLTFEYLTPLRALGLFAVLALPIVFLGMRSLVGLGPVRRWIALGTRLFVLLVIVVILAGPHWVRTNKDLEVIVCRDISQSTQLVRDFPSVTLSDSVDQWLRDASSRSIKPPLDRIGVVSFAGHALIDSPPETVLQLATRPVRQSGSGTDIGGAIELALATLHHDAMHRLALITDGNSNRGDLESALSAAVSQHVPIDVMPLHYEVNDEVLIERFIAPQWRRENEPFTLEIVLRSTNTVPVTGNLTLTHQGRPMDMDPATPGVQPTRHITLMPGRNVENVLVPAQIGSDLIHEFRASFTADHMNQTGMALLIAQPGDASGSPGSVPAPAPVASRSAAPDEPGDTIPDNNTADAFTFVRGKGKVLYVDNVEQGRGRILREALASQGIEVEQVSADAFPHNLVLLQNYDAVILANVPRGPGGLSEEDERMLANYVHDTGGGLVMIGGDQTFGAGGWQGSKLEEVLPVSMDIPAQRQIPKGALVMVIDEIEQPEGNYWAEQCALRALETLSAKDDVGIVSSHGQPYWDFPLGPKGDGSRAVAAIKAMDPGDMPSFDNMILAALDGSGGNPGLLQDDARQKHVVVISDDDPDPPTPETLDRFVAAKISISGVIDFPHWGSEGPPSIMKAMARRTHGRCYGPINSNISQIPQIFIKEATIVRRSLIVEDKDGLPIVRGPSTELIKGIGTFPSVYGMVLTARKGDPQVFVPLTAGHHGDPLLAQWQSGLGKAVVWTSDAHNNWGANWVASADFAKFWAQIVRGVSRAPQSSDFDVQSVVNGDRGRITVEALGKDSTFLNFLTVRGHVVGPDGRQQEVPLVQTGPGTYVGEYEVTGEGNYVAVLDYAGPNGQGGVVLAGSAVNDNPELRDLKSNDAVLRQIAQRTGGRMLKPFDPTEANLFSRANLLPSAAPLPIWDWLTAILLGMIVLDVAIRRIAWNLGMARRAAEGAARQIRGFTVAPVTQPGQSLDALRRTRGQVQETFAQRAAGAAPNAPAAQHDPSAKFEAKGIEGDITNVVGGATPQPTPGQSRKPDTSAKSEGTAIGGLMAAKKRAQEEIRKKQQGDADPPG